jgi:hypothetical protein
MRPPVPHTNGLCLLSPSALVLVIGAVLRVRTTPISISCIPNLITERDNNLLIRSIRPVAMRRHARPPIRTILLTALPARDNRAVFIVVALFAAFLGSISVPIFYSRRCAVKKRTNVHFHLVALRHLHLCSLCVCGRRVSPICTVWRVAGVVLVFPISSHVQLVSLLYSHINIFSTTLLHANETVPFAASSLAAASSTAAEYGT